MIGYESYINKLALALRGRLFLGEYSLRLEFWTKPITDYENSTATCNVDDVYLSLTVNVGPKMKRYWKCGRYWTICQVICHELCHAITEPLYLCSIQRIPEKRSGAWGMVNNEWSRTRERQTQRITNIVMAGLPRRFYQPATVGQSIAQQKPRKKRRTK